MLFPAYSIPYFIFHITYLIVTTTISLWAIMQILQILRKQATDSFKSLFIYFPKVFQAGARQAYFRNIMAMAFPKGPQAGTPEADFGKIMASTFLKIPNLVLYCKPHSSFSPE